MAESAGSIPSPRLELPMVEARTRFQQLARQAGVTRQTVIVVENGRALAAVVPVEMADRCEHGSMVGAAASPSPSAGWIRRIEKVTADQRRQHAIEIGEVIRALDQVWGELDKLRPPGADPSVDALRAAHADVRRTR